MSTLERHVAELRADDRLSPALKKVGETADKAGKQAEEAGKRATRATQDWGEAATKTGVAIGTMVGVTSALGQANQKEEQQLKALQRAYGDSADDIDKMAQKYQDMGIASDDAVRIATLGAQSLSKNYGLTTDEIGKLVERSADLSQTTFDQYGNQLGLADVMQRVQSAIRGEAESAEILGVAMSDTRLASLAAAEGLTGWTTTMTDAEKAQFRLKVFLDDTSAAQGAAAERSEDLSAKVNAMKLNVIDAGAAFGGALGPIGESAAVLGDLAVIAPVAGGAIGKLVGSTSLLSLAMGPVGIVAAAGLAAGAVYLLTDRQESQEKQVRQLAEATDDYTQSLLDNTTALVRAGTYDVAQQTEDYLQAIIANGQEAQSRIDAVREAEFFLSQEVVIGQENRWAALETLNDYTKAQLAAADADHNGSLSAAELATAYELLGAGFEATTEQSLRLTNAVAAVTSATSNPDLYGQLLAQDQLDILRQLGAGYLDVEDAIAQLNSLPTMEKYNVALQESLDDVQAVKINVWELNNALFGGVIALEANADALDQNTEAVQYQANAYTGSWPVIEQYTATLGESVGILGEVSGATVTAGKSLDDMVEHISDLALALNTLPQDSLENTFKVIVGNTNAIQSTVDGVMSWFDGLVGVEGQMAAIDELRAKGLITEARYAMAQRAYNRASEDSADIQEDILTIQAKQAPLIARQIRDQERQLDLIADMAPTAALAALGWMDAAEAQENLTLQTELGAAANTKYGSTARQAMESYIDAIIATDPVQTAMLEQQGLIFRDQEGNWQINWDNADQINSDMDRLVDSLNDMVTLLEYTYNVDVNGDGVVGVNEQLGITKEKLDIVNETTATPSIDDSSVGGANSEMSTLESHLNEIDGKTSSVYIDTHYRDFYERNQRFAMGGVVPADSYETAGSGRVSGGGLVKVGEHGPEFVSLPGGSLVTPNHATRFRDDARGGGITINGPITVIANDPQSFIRQLRQTATTLERR